MEGKDLVTNCIEAMAKSGAEHMEVKFDSALGYRIELKIQKLEDEK